MDQGRFDEAQKAYKQRDYIRALQGFLAAAESGPTGAGEALHMAGNSYMHLKKYRDAIKAYRAALQDPSFDKKSAVCVNLGTAYASVGDYDAAETEFDIALQDTSYATPYKALSGLGNVYLKRGNAEEAGIMYRRAALSDDNPDPGRALVNLGICFMALGRPNDAVESYKAALGFEHYKGHGKALSNLGQAYVGAGRMREAMSAFEKAVETYDQELSPKAQKDYETAQRAVAAQMGIGLNRPVQAAAPVPEQQVAQAAPTPEQPPAQAQKLEEASVEEDSIDDEEVPSGLLRQDTGVIPALVMDNTNFFEATEEELREKDREVRKEKRHGMRGWLKALIVVVAIVLVAAVAGTTLFFTGNGWPTQKATITDMIDSYAKGDDVSSYWVADPSTDVTRAMMSVPATPSKNLTIDSVKKGPFESEATITMKLDNGTSLDYKVKLEREGLGWKVAGIENYFPSNDSSSSGS